MIYGREWGIVITLEADLWGILNTLSCIVWGILITLAGLSMGNCDYPGQVHHRRIASSLKYKPFTLSDFMTMLGTHG